MKFISALMLISLLTACASTPFTFDGDNANKGFVVLSTGISDACMDEFDNTNLLVRRVSDDEMAITLNIKNVFHSPEVEKNNVQINSFPLEAGEYVIRDFIAPNPLFAFKQEYYSIKPIKLSVKPGQVQYKGYLFFDAKGGECDKNHAKVARKDMKKRDMQHAQKENPQVVSSI